ncbi:MAG: helix-turn-helix transcriptional regulator [Bacteroidaceae bacterium]|nr:helix-turn-helix transcriptional regulator [Bacteroidaceae bacterium]
MNTFFPSPLLVHAGEALHHADWNWKGVRSPFLRLYYVTEGEARVEMESCTLNLQPDHLYLIPAFTTHNYVCSTVFRHYYLHVYDERESQVDELLALSKPSERSAHHIDLALFRRLCHLNPTLSLQSSNPESYDNHAILLRNIETSRNKPLSVALETKGILQVLMSRFINNDTVGQFNNIDSRIQDAIHFIYQRLSSSLTLTKLASEACMSKDHFIRLFRQSTGTTPTRYITLQRMHRAETLLISTNNAVKSIAMSLGYDDVSYFTRVFRSVVGFTPLQYREARV